MTRDYLIADPFITLPSAPGLERHVDPSLARLFKKSDAYFKSETVEDMIQNMDQAGIEVAVVHSRTAGTQIPPNPWAVGQNADDAGFDANCAAMADAVARYPDRLQGCVPIDPTGGMAAVRQLERAVHQFGARSIWIMPSLIGLPANHPTYYSIYMKCVELGLPAKINVGAPGPARFAKHQGVMALDEVLIAFPELVVVGAHVGHPWQQEVIALLAKHQNFYLITSGYLPRHVPAEIWDFANRRGANKIMWSSDYPLLGMQKTAEQGWEVPLRDDVKRRYLRENAIAVYRLK
jgi:predicted TIM-barrel fold metal-dependent hydrolase